MKNSRICFSALLLSPLVAAGAEPPRAPLVSVRFASPDQQLKEFLALFEGEKIAHPAAGLAAWKRATRMRAALSKASEAGIALLNPLTAAELRMLRDARLSIDAGQGGEFSWRLVAPHDEYVLASLATAMALTEGASESAILDKPVDRIGPPGSPVISAFPGFSAIASSRAELQVALEDRTSLGSDPVSDSGMIVRIKSEAWITVDWKSIERRRIAALLKGLGAEDFTATFGIRGDSAKLELVGRYGRPVRQAPKPITLERLATIPAQDVAIAIAIAIDPTPEAWADLFGLADRVQKADPAYANVLPIRLRLNLLANAAKIRPDVELWPRLREVFGFATTDAKGEIDGALLTIDFDSADSAKDVSERILPNAAGLLGLSEPARSPDGRLTWERARGRRLVVSRELAAVTISWGDQVQEASRLAAIDPKRSACSALAGAPGEPSPRRLVAVWPGRIGPVDFRDAPPLVWRGGADGNIGRDVIRLSGLKQLIHLIINRIPMEFESSTPGGPRP